MSDHPVIERIEKTGYSDNLQEQLEHWGNDVFDDEILEGDDVVFDGGEVILRSNLEEYLSEMYGFKFQTAK
ncbi:hypothetical protein [Bacillus sp. B15-48]|uniref:YqaI family protein n=1 Tax=Bacillus sp. B15-48 TaxID=1548601 RepID=UPI00193ED784|nr:hypothetical protein [Bacillus sp. B15-48]MBM4762740.1 hypothetical protein [Bacillus sp. B15-48]